MGRRWIPSTSALALAAACGRAGFDASTDVTVTGDGGSSNDAAAALPDPCNIDNRPPSPAFDCSTVEVQILAGNIAAVPDTQLIEWARNGCMKKPAPPAFATTPASSLFPFTAGTGPDCSAGAPPSSQGMAPNYYYAGSGTLNLGTLSGTCGATNVLGTYDRVAFATITTSQAVSSHYDGCRHVGVDAVSGAATVRAWDFNAGAASPFPIVLLAKTIQATGQVLGGSGDDVVVVTGNMGGDQIRTSTGDDTVVIGQGLLADDATNSFVYLENGNDTAYVHELGILGNSPEMDIFGGPGDDAIYFNMFRVEDINAGPGNDVLSCTGLFGTPSCTYYRDWATLDGGDGNDIISVDGPLLQDASTSGPTSASGGPGFNILYFARIDNTAPTTGINLSVTTTGSSLLVLGGDHRTAMPSTVMAAGANNVLLVEATAVNSGFSFNGFARMLTY